MAKREAIGECRERRKERGYTQGPTRVTCFAIKQDGGSIAGVRMCCWGAHPHRVLDVRSLCR
jgi:hypothetical protein